MRATSIATLCVALLWACSSDSPGANPDDNATDAASGGSGAAQAGGGGTAGTAAHGGAGGGAAAQAGANSGGAASHSGGGSGGSAPYDSGTGGLQPTPTPTPQGNSYYVASTGSDTNAGTSNAPWATLQHAADTVSTGDTVIVRAGHYKGFAMDPESTADGHSDNPILFRAEPDVIIDQPNDTKNNGINLERSSYIIIDGFTIQPTGSSWNHGIRCTSGTGVVVRFNHVLMRDSDVLGIFSSFMTDWVVEFNEVTGSNDAGIYTSNSALRAVIRANRVHDTAGMGIHNNGDASMTPSVPLNPDAVFGQITQSLIDANEIVNTAGGLALSCDGVQHSRIQNNLIYNISRGKGISLFQVDAAGPSNDNVVINNTIVMAAGTQSAILVKQGATGNVIYNNIALGGGGTSGGLSICDTCVVTSDYNLVNDRMSASDEDTFVSLAQWQAQTGNDTHSAVTSAAQLFASPATGDYHLAAGCAAIDAATSNQAPGWDREGTTRPQGAGVDIGAYEKQ
jgi:hypothetical protein